MNESGGVFGYWVMSKLDIFWTSAGRYKLGTKCFVAFVGFLQTNDILAVNLCLESILVFV